jgi:hypothetical protein
MSRALLLFAAPIFGFGLLAIGVLGVLWLAGYWDEASARTLTFESSTLDPEPHVATSTPSPIPTFTPVPPPTPTPCPDCPPVAAAVAPRASSAVLGIELSWPPEVDRDQARTIRLTIVADGLVAFTTTEFAGGARISLAIGQVYPDTASAQLVSNSFQILDVSPSQQPVTAARTTWEWNVSSSKPGKQWVNVSVDFAYPEQALLTAAERPPSRWSYEFAIDVRDKPFIELGTISIAALASPLLAGLLSLPSIFSLIREHLAKQS